MPLKTYVELTCAFFKPQSIDLDRGRILYHLDELYKGTDETRMHNKLLNCSAEPKMNV